MSYKGGDGIYPLDTGTPWIDVSSGLQAGWTADTAVAYRYGNVVHLVVKNLDYGSGGDANALQLPVGFRPDYTIGITNQDTSTVAIGTITAAGMVTASTSADNIEISEVYLTTGVWPSL